MIYAIGDSFTYGDELTNRELAWPILVGKEFDIPVTNLGKKGTGNTRMVKRVIDVAYRDDAELVLVAWTNPGRLEIFNNRPIDVWPAQQIRNILSPGEQHITQLITTMHNDKWDTWATRKWIREIILCQNLLENQNKKYLMLVAWHDWSPTAETEDLWAKVNTKQFIGFNTPDYETMCYWFGDAPKGPGGHPLELGHQRIAEKINEHIRNLGWLS